MIQCTGGLAGVENDFFQKLQLIGFLFSQWQESSGFAQIRFLDFSYLIFPFGKFLFGGSFVYTQYVNTHIKIMYYPSKLAHLLTVQHTFGRRTNLMNFIRTSYATFAGSNFYGVEFFKSAVFLEQSFFLNLFAQCIFTYKQTQFIPYLKVFYSPQYKAVKAHTTSNKYPQKAF